MKFRFARNYFGFHQIEYLNEYDTTQEATRARHHTDQNELMKTHLTVDCRLHIGIQCRLCVVCTFTTIYSLHAHTHGRLIRKHS